MNGKTEIANIESYLRDVTIAASSRFQLIDLLPNSKSEARELGMKNYYTASQKAYLRTLVRVKVDANSPLTPIIKHSAEIQARASKITQKREG